MAVKAQLQAKGGRPRSDCTEREAAAASGRAAYSLANTPREIRIKGHVAERVTACDSMCTQRNMPTGTEDVKDLTLDWDGRLPLSTVDMNKKPLSPKSSVASVLAEM